MQDYGCLKELGKGSFGCVVKAQYKQTGQLCAIKKIKMNALSARDRDNALNEVRLLASIDSPNVIQYKSAFFQDKDNSLCIVMEYADGGDLAGLIKKKAQKKSLLLEKFIWQVACDLLKGLKTLHANRIIHRDIKPANVFFVDGVAKLGDLNVSKVLEGRFTSTQTGTPYYTPPEIWNNQKYDGKCDIWALGCVLYEMASLHPPFLANDIPALMRRVTQGLYDPIPHLYSPRLSRLIRRCLHLRMSERPSAYQLLDDEIFSAMDTQEEGEISLLDTIHCPKVLKMLQKKLPEIKSMKKIATQKNIKEDNSSRIEESGMKKMQSMRNIALEKDHAKDHAKDDDRNHQKDNGKENQSKINHSVLMGPMNSPKSLIKLPKIMGTKNKLQL